MNIVQIIKKDIGKNISKNIGKNIFKKYPMNNGLATNWRLYSSKTAIHPSSYFKITNEDESHRGYQYKDGLNILDKSFEREGSCVPGGLYFTTAKHIAKFLHYGCYLREITLPSDCVWVKDPEEDKYRANKIILGQKYDLADPQTFQLLFEKGCDITYPRTMQYILVWACKNKHLPVVKYLFEHDKNVYIDYNYNNDLNLACEYGNLEIVKYFIEKGADIHNQHNQALRIASEHGHVDVVKYLVENKTDMQSGDNYNIVLFSKIDGKISEIRNYANRGSHNDYEAALTIAAKGGHIDVVKYFMENWDKINKYYYNRVLQIAIEYDHSAVAKYLIEKGANMYNNNGILKITAAHGRLDIIKYLAEKETNVFDCGGDVLTHACRNEHWEVIRFLVENGANIHADNDCVLKWAAGSGQLDMVQNLLKRDTFALTSCNSALMLACYNGHLEVVQLLVENGADINAEDHLALRWASRGKHHAIVKYLVEKGADINVLNINVLN